MRVTGLDYVSITAPTGSADRVRDFYGLALGLEEVPPPAGAPDTGGLWFNCGGPLLHVSLEADSRAAHPLAFRVEGLDDLRAALEAHAFAVEPEEAGAARLRCRDAAGNRVVLIAHVSPAGSLLTHPELVADYAAGDGDVERIAVSADGQWLAFGTSVENNTGRPVVTVWRWGRPQEPEVVIDMAASVWELAFAPTGRELVALSEDGSLETWRVGEFESDQFAELPSGSTGLAYSPDGTLLAVGAGNKVELYRAGLDHLHTIRPGLGKIQALAFDPAGLLAVSPETERIQLWQIRPAQLSSWEVIGHQAPAIQLKAHPSQNILAAITDADQLVLWNVDQAPEEPVDLTGDLADINALAFSPDGALLAAGDEAGRIRLWDWHAQTVARELEAELPVLSLAFAPDGAHLLVGHEAARVRVWKIK